MVRILLAFIALSIAVAVNAADFEQSLRRGLDCKAQGLLHQAKYTLEQAKALSQTLEQQTQATGSLGQVYYQLHRYNEAKTLLENVYQNTQGTKKADYANLLGNLYANQHDNKQAEYYYAQAAQLAGNDKVLGLRIALNRVRALNPSTSLEILQKLSIELESILDKKEQTRLYLNLGEQAHALGKDGLSLAYDSFEKSRKLSTDDHSSRLQAESLNALASLYEEQQRYSESLRLTQQAIASMQTSNERDILFNLEWRQGRLLRQAKQRDFAISAYQRAVEHLEIIRQDIPVDYQNGRSSFRETLEPVYLGLADILLEKAKQTDNENQQILLRKARDTVELIKQTELDDFLGGRCTVANARQANIELIDGKTAIIYPIVLPERLELLVSTHEGLFQFTVAIDAASLQTQVQKMARNLRNKIPSNIAIKLYNWLIAPAEALFKNQGIETLIFIPDGSLRLLPIAALYDGKQYVIEKYAVATSPGLTLFDPKISPRPEFNTLLLGMSNPGSVVEKLPARVVNGFIGVNTDSTSSENRELLPTDNTRNLADKARNLRELVKSRNGNIEQLMRDPEFIAGMKDQLKLPGVKQEVTSLSEQLANNTLLLDNTFTLSRFKQEVMLSNYSIVHIASHGIFGSNAENSFLMTYDELLHIDELESLLKSEKFKQEPVELLTLSACQTAEGDDRAPLGFAGIALKAHARSALGSLWSISDEAAYALMTQFYKNLTQNKMSKVKALQQAQLSLLQQTDMKNPFYWSPFILVGNWL